MNPTKILEPLKTLDPRTTDQQKHCPYKLRWEWVVIEMEELSEDPVLLALRTQLRQHTPYYIAKGFGPLNEGRWLFYNHQTKQWEPCYHIKNDDFCVSSYVMLDQNVIRLKIKQPGFYSRVEIPYLKEDINVHN